MLLGSAIGRRWDWWAGSSFRTLSHRNCCDSMCLDLQNQRWGAGQRPSSKPSDQCKWRGTKGGKKRRKGESNTSLCGFTQDALCAVACSSVCYSQHTILNCWQQLFHFARIPWYKYPNLQWDCCRHIILISSKHCFTKLQPCACFRRFCLLAVWCCLCLYEEGYVRPRLPGHAVLHSRSLIVIPSLIILVAEAKLHTCLQLYKWRLLVQTFRNVYRRICDEDM